MSSLCLSHAHANTTNALNSRRGMEFAPRVDHNLNFT